MAPSSRLDPRSRPGRKGGRWASYRLAKATRAVEATPSSTYSMAKAGRHAVTLHVAVDLASPRICVNTTSPAMVETPAYEPSVPKAPDHAQADWEAEV